MLITKKLLVTEKNDSGNAGMWISGKLILTISNAGKPKEAVGKIGGRAKKITRYREFINNLSTFCW